ncbi:MAG: BrnT family toxin, partial [Caldilineales bacterium]|nr:BrnT family toxin [Caldilineales bacterium]
MMLIFEWDKNKARTNLGKHKVSFEEAKTLFSDPLMVSYPDEHHSDIEERFV